MNILANGNIDATRLIIPIGQITFPSITMLLIKFYVDYVRGMNGVVTVFIITVRFDAPGRVSEIILLLSITVPLINRLVWWMRSSLFSVCFRFFHFRFSHFSHIFQSRVLQTDKSTK